uniref:C2H2-type domain-containing protein n=1 Tax=Rhizophagus irregularis (strain DAOM 181602 / DAOM 197198 / MUCL 43194) TaxID=747089 RepID=U9TE26_RHIID
MFCNFDLDYLSVRTHAPGQSAYNPVERSMSTLSQKLAGITLPIDKFGSHLNSQGQVTDLELAMKNFRYAGEALCTFWKRDPIFGKPKCEDSSCCSPKRHEEAAVLLAENDGFLPPVTKGKDGHFLNPLHILEYCDKLKIPGNDAHCPSINADTYERLCCSECDAYFPTLSMVAQHKKIQHPK